MKKWKIVVLALVILASLYFLYSCYSFLALKRAFQSIQDLKSVHIEGEFVVGSDETRVTFTGSANYVASLLYANLEVDDILYPMKLEMYTIFHEQSVDFYYTTNLFSKWFSSKFSNSNLGEKEDSVKKQIKVKRIETFKLSSQKFYIEISKDLLISFLSSYFQEVTYEGDSFSFYLLVESGKIKELIVENEEKVSLFKTPDISLYQLHFTFSSWNSISDITLPEKVSNDSIEVNENIWNILFG